MPGFVRNLFRPHKDLQSFAFSRPLVILQSDDWGRVGVRDREGYELLRASGVRLGERPYDLYTLETADDVMALASLLGRHRDSTGRPPCLVMNTCTANLDFGRMRGEGFKRPHLLPLANGLPGSWLRPGLFESYRAGIEQGVFCPALQGTAHFCPLAFSNAVVEDGARARFLRLFWEAETPSIYWRMPWVGYEFWNPEKPRAGFLDADHQRKLVKQGCQNFCDLFGVQPLSACAPGCRANRDTHRVWSEAGIHVAENGSDNGFRPPNIDEFGVLHLYRSIDFEISHRELEIEKYLEIAANGFSRGHPVIISVHSINFHSTLKDFRSASIAALDRLLTALESKYSELLYVNDEDLYGIVTKGAFHSRAAKVRVTMSREGRNSRLANEEAP